MAAIVEELFQGRTEVVSTKSSAEIPYVVRHAADEEEVKEAALAEIPAFHAGVPRKSIEITERINADTWKVVARYETQESAPEEEETEPSFSFDTTGGTQHITQSLATRGRYPSASAPDLGGAIGYDGEQVNGVDIVMPNLSFSLARIVEAGEITTAFRLTLANLTGKVNASNWKGYEAGEVLFLGATGSGKTDQPVEISYRFAHSPNRRNFSVGGIEVTEKKGWDYMWVRYADEVDGDKKALVRKPAAVYIEQVYEAADFAALGLGR